MSGIQLLAPASANELRERYGGRLDAGMQDRTITRVVAPSSASAPTDLIVLSSVRELRGSLADGMRPPSSDTAAPGIWLCSEACAPRLPSGGRWVHSHVMWVVAELLAPLAARSDFGAFNRASGQAERALVAGDAVIGPGAVIHQDARIGPGCRIGPNAVIYGRVELGKRVIVGASAVIGRPGFGFTEGPSGERVRIPQPGGVIIEDDVEIGALCTVDAGTLGPTRLGRGAKLDAQVHVGHNVQIGAYTMIAAQAGFAGSSRLGEHVLVGGQAGVTDHAHVGQGARIAAKSGVVGDIPPGVTVAGFPAVPRLRWLRAMAGLLKQSARERKS